MNENLLHYLWKNLLFKPGNLFTTEGDPVTIIHPGLHNTNAGPDFLEARIKIGSTLWAGNVELHTFSSDWQKHGHQQDPLYQNIILHVVFRHDAELEGAAFPTLVLDNHVDDEVVERYRHLMTITQPIPCKSKMQQVPEIVWIAWLERLVAERWEQKLVEWEELWLRSGKDWRSLLYYRLAANFGFYVNRDAFLELALSLPLDILVKHRNRLVQVEALLLGQAGFLEPSGDADPYVEELEKEYQFLRRKYSLVPMKLAQWKFLRLRPANFPTIRIAQFAMLIHKSLELFAHLMEVKSQKEIAPLLQIAASDYWNNHYRPGQVSKETSVKYLGTDALHNIIINTVAPMQYLYARLQGKEQLHENSLSLLQSLKPENNKTIREWQNQGMVVTDAAQSQALLQLFNQYCEKKRCLECAVGNRLIRSRQ